MSKLDEAKTTIRNLLAVPGATPALIHRAIVTGARWSRLNSVNPERTELEQEEYALQALALSDLTGDARYRLGFPS